MTTTEDAHVVADEAINDTAVAQPDDDNRHESSMLRQLPLTATNLESSVRSCMEEFKLQGKQAAIDRAFQELDTTKDGQLERAEVAAFMEQAAKEIKLNVSQSVIVDAVDALMDDVGAKS
jgi:hypothetical protein